MVGLWGWEVSVKQEWLGLSISPLASALTYYILVGGFWLGPASKSVPEGSGSPQRVRHLEYDAGDWCLEGGEVRSKPGEGRPIGAHRSGALLRAYYVLDHV